MRDRLSPEAWLEAGRRVVEAPNLDEASQRARLLNSSRRGLREIFNRPASPAWETVETDVGPLRLPADDQVVLPWLRRYGTWEPHESEVLRSLMATADWVLDVGAHVGYHSLLAASMVGGNGRVVSLEPHPVNFALLQANLSANSALGSRALPFAASDTTGLRDFGVSPSNSGDHGFATGAGRGRQEVMTVAVDDLVSPGWPIRVVKIDIQGADHRALRGMPGLISRHRPALLVEFWPDGIQALGDDPEEALGEYLLPGYTMEVVGDAGREPAPDSRAGVVSRAMENEGGFVSLLLLPRGDSPLSGPLSGP